MNVLMYWVSFNHDGNVRRGSTREECIPQDDADGWTEPVETEVIFDSPLDLIGRYGNFPLDWEERCRAEQWERYMSGSPGAPGDWRIFEN